MDGETGPEPANRGARRVTGGLGRVVGCPAASPIPSLLTAPRHRPWSIDRNTDRHAPRMYVRADTDALSGVT